MYKLFVTDGKMEYFNELKKYKTVYTVYLFNAYSFIGKKYLYINPGMLKKYLYFEIDDYKYQSQDCFGIKIKEEDILRKKQLSIEDYIRINAKYPLADFVKNKNNDRHLSYSENTKEDISLQKDKNLEILKMIYPLGLTDDGIWGDKWNEEYEKNWVLNDMGQDSDLTDYNQDGNYLYEDNSNPTNSDFFNKSDSDFLNNS